MLPLSCVEAIPRIGNNIYQNSSGVWLNKAFAKVSYDIFRNMEYWPEMMKCIHICQSPN